MRNTKDIRSGEKILFETKPRFFMYLKSAIIKFIALIVIIYIFGYVVSAAASVQNFIIRYVQIPLVEYTTIILFLIMFILIIWIIWNVISWEYTTYTLTNYRIILEEGVIRKNKSYIHYNKIQDINVSQGVIERLTSSGDILIFGGHEHTRMVLNDIPNPTKVENRINQLIEGDFIAPKQTGPQKIKDSVINRYDKKFKRY